MTSVAKRKDDDLKPRQAPVIPAANIVLNHSGMLWREFIVRLPSEFIADDLKEPEVWSLVQRGGCSLANFDRLLLVAFNESWIAEAIVADAGARHVVLAKPRITQMPEKFGNLFQTEDYRVAWNGVGYFVERKKDSKRMTRPVASAALAERDLAALYPSKTSSAVA